MKLTIKLNEGKTLRDAALKVQEFNILAAASPLLVNGPIACNPDSYYETPAWDFVDTGKINEIGMKIFDQIPIMTELKDENGNIVMSEPISANIPVMVQKNIKAEKQEGFLGTTNTPPNEFGYVTIDIPNYRKLSNTLEVLQMKMFFLDTFITIDGDAVEDKELEDGTIIQVYGGKIQ